jgi:apolipoprotein N-acyltransferase
MNPKSLAGAFAAGLLCVFGFAPFGIFLIPLLALAALFALWRNAINPRAAGWLGFSFGLGFFLAGTGWIYVALHDFGGMPILLALPSTLLFSAFLALFFALAGYLQARFPYKHILVMPAVWVLIEWLRGTIFTGFPWLTMGYANSDSWLAGYAPVFGVYGVSLAVALSAGLIAALFQPAAPNGLQTKLRLISYAAILWAGGGWLSSIAWTQPYGAPFSVTLVQGNIAQDRKFNEDALQGTLQTILSLSLQNPARLTLLSETAVPLFREEVPEYLLDQLRNHAIKNGGDILIGSFERGLGGYYNGVFTQGMAPEQHYRKHHLVPFGEFIPLRRLVGWIVNGVLKIPMSDLARGASVQAPLAVAGQRVAADICYEDVFGEEIIRSLPEATLLVNITNDAWYGHSHAAAQHNQISQMRALESGRMMLRATNTGVSSIIAANGRVLQQLPQHTKAALTGIAQGYQGSTPYVRFGNAAVLLLIALLLAIAVRSRKQ